VKPPAALVQHDPWPDTEARLDLLEAMRTLTPTKQRVLDMHLAGYTNQEIGEAVYRGRVAPSVISNIICDAIDRYCVRHGLIALRRSNSIYARLARAVHSGPAVFRALLDEVYEQSREGRARRTEAEELIRAERAKKRAARELKRKRANERAAAQRKHQYIPRDPGRLRTFMFAESRTCLWGDHTAAMERLGSGECFGWWLVGPRPAPLALRDASPPAY